MWFLERIGGGGEIKRFTQKMDLVGGINRLDNTMNIS